MARAQEIAFALAVSACGTSKPAPPEPEALPPIVAAAPAPAPAPAPTRAASLAEVFETAKIGDGPDVDATALGDVTVLLAYRIGGVSGPDRRVEPALLIAGSSTIRIPLSDLYVADRGQPFGAILATDPQDGAPVLPLEGDVVTTLTMRDTAGNRATYVVTREAGALALRTAVELDGKPLMDRWMGAYRVVLAGGASAIAADPPGDLAPPPAAVEVEIREALTSDYQDLRHYDVTLQVGDRIGVLAAEAVLSDDDASWGRDARPADLPGAGVALASRRYGDVELVIGRAGNDLAAWRRERGGAWVELARVPLRPSAEVTLGSLPVSPPPRARVAFTPKKIKPVELVQPEKPVERDVEYPEEEVEEDDGESEGVEGGVVDGPPLPPPPPPPRRP